MNFNQWLLLAGGLVLLMGLLHPWLRRAPITPAMLYLAVGALLSPWVANQAWIDPILHAHELHRVAEIAVIISLFTVGMKLRIGVTDARVRPAWLMAFGSMTVTVGLVAATGVTVLGMSLGAAILLGGIVAPTDPVLASAVQIKNPQDRDQVRLTLSAEGGLNDGTAFPFVMLGLAMLHGEDLGAGLWRWWTVDVLWAVAAGLGIGAVMGAAVGRFLVWRVSKHREAVAFGEYLVLGLIGVSYAVALEVNAYGFLSVFAAGAALRAVERRASADGWSRRESSEAEEGAEKTPGDVASMLLHTNEQLENLMEVTLVLIVGVLLASAGIAWEVVWLAPLLFVVIRPVAVAPILAFRRFTWGQFGSVAWFGIRGIGSIYYLFYAVSEGLPEELARQIVSITVSIVAVSVFVHGISLHPWRKLRE